MINEGYIKFKPKCINKNKLPKEILPELNKYRAEMVIRKLIGIKNRVGFGNISKKVDDNFIITGSATGGIKELDENHYVRVTSYNLDENSVEYEGPIKPSSESMTHASIYDSDLGIKAVIHVHNLDLWKKLLNRVPTTSKHTHYGTPEMAKEVKRLFRETDVKEKKIFVTAGHEEGVFSFGKNLEEAAKLLLKYFEG